MFRICCLCVLVLIAFQTYSQPPALQWAAQFGSSVPIDDHNEVGQAIAVDQQGNVYSAGQFYFTVDFDPGPGVYNLVAPGQATYISKVSPSGTLIWAKQISLANGVGVDMAIDAQGNVYLTSYITMPVNLDPGPAVHIAAPMGPEDAFILKLDSNGNFLWEKQFGHAGAGNHAVSYNITIDQNGDPIIVGDFGGTIDFDPGPSSYLLTATNGATFIMKLTAAGNLQWAKMFGNSSAGNVAVSATDIAVDQAGNIYTTGRFNGTSDFDPGPGSFMLTSAGQADGFVCKLDGSGNFLWAKKFGNSTNNNLVLPRSIVVDAQNNVYTTGRFQATQDFDPGPGVFNLVSIGILDAFVLKLNSQGDFIWAKSFGSTLGQTIYDIAVDNSGNSYIAGSFEGSIDFDPGSGVHILNLSDDGAVLKLDSSGNFVFVAPFVKASSLAGSGVSKVATDAVHNLYATGYFYFKVDFDPGPGTFVLTDNQGFTDAFVVKLSKCLNITNSTLNINSCGSYTLNNHSYTASGTYTQTIPNAGGCDSIITLNLTITKKLTSQTNAICEGQSFYAGGANQTTSGIYVDTLQTVAGCDSVVTTTLVVHPKPIPQLGPDRSICADSALNLSPGVFASYQWQDLSTQASFPVDASGLYWVDVINSDNCVARDSVWITRLPQPANFLKATDSICSYGTLVIQSIGNYQEYLWSTGSIQNNINVTAPGYYWLQVKDANGCSAIDTITVFPKQCMKGVFIPSAFTPNGDGKNDGFKPLVFGAVKDYKLTIYNRWGQVIFQTTDYQKGWDGSLSSVLQTTGVYVWTCTYQLEGEKGKLEKGTVLLIR